MTEDSEDQDQEESNIIGLEPDEFEDTRILGLDSPDDDDSVLDESLVSGESPPESGGDTEVGAVPEEPGAEDAEGDHGDPNPELIEAAGERDETEQVEILDAGWNPSLLTTAKTSLDGWASRWSEEDHPYVKGLSEALPIQQNMTMWASLNPFDRLPFPKVTAGSALDRAAKLLELIRNVAVFVPVAITWWAINVATSEFGKFQKLTELTNSVGEAIDPSKISFLAFWQDGYGLLKGGLLSAKISHIALVDFVIITSIVALTLFSSALARLSARREDREQELADDHRTDLALFLTNALESKRSASPQSIAGSIANVLNDLVDAARQVHGAALQLEQSSQGVASFNSRIEELSQGIEELSDQVANRLSGQIVQAVNDLGRSVTGLNEAVAGDTSRLITDIITGLEGVSEQLKRTSASVEFGTKRLRDDLDDIHRGNS
jgi:methyl-accepting chemotaxis protein